jgi:2-amino-4-hydroxy-6-hydroxymethyldihydropteridine diphosphokinase
MGQTDWPCWVPVYVGLGSNLGDSSTQLHRAKAALAALPQTVLVAASPVYRSRPFGPVAQADFLNAVVALLSQLSPERWLQELQRIEIALGRSAPRVRWGPREIDLDLLAHGQTRRDDAQLSLPHPGIPEREFVLYPLRDIAADLRLGQWGTVRELAVRVSARGIERSGSLGS